MFAGIGPWEFFLIALTCLIFFKPEQLVKMTSSVVKAKKEFKDALEKELGDL